MSEIQPNSPALEAQIPKDTSLSDEPSVPAKRKPGRPKKGESIQMPPDIMKPSELPSPQEKFQAGYCMDDFRQFLEKRYQGKGVTLFDAYNLHCAQEVVEAINKDPEKLALVEKHKRSLIQTLAGNEASPYLSIDQVAAYLKLDYKVMYKIAKQNPEGLAVGRVGWQIRIPGIGLLFYLSYGHLHPAIEEPSVENKTDHLANMTKLETDYKHYPFQVAAQASIILDSSWSRFQPKVKQILGKDLNFDTLMQQYRESKESTGIIRHQTLNWENRSF